jgi:ABC-type Na+ efflux pump permease subunit
VNSLSRIFTIGRNTLTEALRQKVLNVILLFGLAVMVSAIFFVQFSFTEHFKFLKDFGLGAISVFGLLISLMGTAQMIPSEIESRTIYTVLSKPVRRFEFLFGKYVGLIGLIFIAVCLMSVVFVGVLYGAERSRIALEMNESPTMTEGVATQHQLEVEQHIVEIKRQSRDPALVKAIVLIYAKLCVVSVITLLVSTFATSAIFSVSISFMIYLIGHLESIAREEWITGGNALGWQKLLVWFVSLFIPDFSTYNVVDDIVVGVGIPWSHVSEVLGYSVCYIVVALLLGQFIFNQREL